MKKLLSIILALAILIPAMNVSASEVFIPNFSDIVSNRFQTRIEFLGKEKKTYNGVDYTTWVYRCLDGKENEYIDEYIKQLSGRYDLRLIGKDNSNDRRSWYFIYTGVQAKNMKLIDNNFHIHVGISENVVFINLVSGINPE